MKTRVAFVLEWLPEYRLGILEHLRRRLEEDHIEFDIFYGTPPKSTRNHQAFGSDERIGRWVPSYQLRIGSREISHMPISRALSGYDLVILMEGMRLPLNWMMIALSKLGVSRIAFFGQGRDPIRSHEGPCMRIVRRWFNLQPDWWFAYTEGVKRKLVADGMEASRVSVVLNSTWFDPQNGIDTSTSKAQDDRVVGVSLGSLRRGRKLRTTIETADEIARRLPEFELVICGDGEERGVAVDAARSRRHVKYAGRVDGDRKAQVLRDATFALLPNQVGLNVVEALQHGLPVVTGRGEGHGPEFEYVIDGENGLVASSSDSPEELADLSIEIVRRHSEYAANALDTGNQLSGRQMVERMVEGIHEALRAGR